MYFIPFGLHDICKMKTERGLKVRKLADNEKNENLKSILAYSCYLIYKKSEIYEGDGDTE